MKNTVKILSSRQKNALLEKARATVSRNLTKKDAIAILCKYLVTLSLVIGSGEYNAMLSVSLAFYCLEKARFDGLKAFECLSAYAAFKRSTEKHLSDFGAFGDFAETLIRCACKPLNLISFNDLHVKRQNETDITIRGKRFEIGTNGKTFTDSTEDNPTNGKYHFIAYGVFTREEKETLYRLAIKKEYTKAFDNILNMVYVFDKNEFMDCMNDTGRGSMMKYKINLKHWQVIYNESKHSAFLKMVKKRKIPTLKEWIDSH